jgi:hypothetical protein
VKRAPLKAKTAKVVRRPKARPKAAKPLKTKKTKKTKATRTTKPTARTRKAAVKTKKAPVNVRKAAKPTKKAPSRPAKAIARKAVKTAASKPVAKPKPILAAKPRPAAIPPPPPTLQRERRRLPEAEEETFTDVSEDSRLMSSARAGHDELRSEMKKHTESSPAMTAGDVDAKWQDAYALGDEAPGGDNMTPDQDRVDDIGKALGIEYADDEELLGGGELTERDEHRWELDPASKDEDEEL